MTEKTQAERNSFSRNGRPSAVPIGLCPVCRKSLRTGPIGFCETDWNWECKSHLSTQMHGNLHEVRDRKEPVMLTSYSNGAWVTEKVL